jgi:AbrB family looped-hinge helix DNA binding protein
LTLLVDRVKLAASSQQYAKEGAMQDTYKTKIGDEGRILLPLNWRKAVHARPGDELVIQVRDDGLHISTVEQAIKRFQSLVAQHVPPDADLVEELLCERRAEVDDE